MAFSSLNWQSVRWWFGLKRLITEMMISRGAGGIKVKKLRYKYGLTVDFLFSYLSSVLQLQRLILWSVVGKLQTVLLEIWKDSVIVCFKVLSQYEMERLNKTMKTLVMVASEWAETELGMFWICMEHYHCTSLFLLKL